MIEVPLVVFAMLVGWVTRDLVKIFLASWKRRHEISQEERISG